MVKEVDDRLLQSRKGNFKSLGISNPKGIDHFGSLEVRNEDGLFLGDEIACRTNEHDMQTFSIPHGCNPLRITLL